MNQPKKASFSFVGFKIPNFKYNEPEAQPELLSVAFDPHGLYNVENGVFELRMYFKGFSGDDPEKNIITEAILVAHFKFEEILKFEEIPTFFYQSAIGIVFPYLRSFFSTITMQANVKLVMLPIINLTGIEETFKSQTKIST